MKLSTITDLFKQFSEFCKENGFQINGIIEIKTIKEKNDGWIGSTTVFLGNSKNIEDNIKEFAYNDEKEKE